MRSHADGLAVIQHQDQIGMHQTGRSLADDKYRHLFIQLTDCFSKCRIRCKIQCTCTVIQDQNLRIFHQSTGDRQTLFLTSRQIASSLLHRFIQLFLFFLYKFGCLCSLKSCQEHLIGRSWIAPKKVRTDRTGKQLCFLHDHTNLATQLFS